jgi:hypothetical protein
MQPSKTIELPRRFVWFVAILLLLAIAMPLTKPVRAKHEQWLKDHYLMPWNFTPPGPRPMLKPESLEERLKTHFAYHDYGFFSTMTDNDRQGMLVSYGYLGSVWGRYLNR